jgi:predicted aspartyl protease
MATGTANAQHDKILGEFDPTHGLPTLKIGISALSSTKIFGAVALVDTGASSCLVDQSVVDQLRLEPFGTQKNFSTAGLVDYPTYICRIGLGDKTAFKQLVAGRPVGPHKLPYKVIIGMSILQYYDVRIRKKDQLISLQRVVEPG